MVKIKSTTKFERKNKFFLLFNAQVLIFRNLSNKLLEIKCKRKHLLLKVGPSVYEKEVNCIEDKIFLALLYNNLKSSHLTRRII